MRRAIRNTAVGVAGVLAISAVLVLVPIGILLGLDALGAFG